MCVNSHVRHCAVCVHHRPCLCYRGATRERLDEVLSLFFPTAGARCVVEAHLNTVLPALVARKQRLGGLLAVLGGASPAPDGAAHTGGDDASTLVNHRLPFVLHAVLRPSRRPAWRRSARQGWRWCWCT